MVEKKPITWDSAKSFKKFLAELTRHGKKARKRYGCKAFDLCLNPSFIGQYCRLTQDETQSLLDALLRVPIGDLSIYEMGHDDLDDARHVASVEAEQGHLDRLYDCIGSISSLKKLYIVGSEGLDPRIVFSRLLPCLGGVTSLELTDAYSGLTEQQLPDVAQGIRGLTSLSDASITAPSWCWPLLFSTLGVMPTLARVMVSCAECDSLQAAHALVELLSAESLLDVTLDTVDVEDDEESIRVLYQGIENTRACGISLINCSFMDANSFATAILASRVKKLQIQYPCLKPLATESMEPSNDVSTRLFDSSEEERLFVDAFIRLLPSMADVEELDIRLCIADRDEALNIALARSAAFCSNLKRMTFGCGLYSSITDDACAEILESNKKLQILEIFCLATPDGHSAPAVLEALKTNYSLEQFRISAHFSECTNCLAPAARLALEPYLRLNRAGRRYLEHDAANAAKAINVLGQVNDDLDSIFVHVRENPFTLGHSMPLPAFSSKGTKGRKRKATSVLTLSIH